jgi:hypothetical protein
MEIDAVYKLTDEEKRGVEVGLRDIREGKIFKSREANKRIAQ